MRDHRLSKVAQWTRVEADAILKEMPEVEVLTAAAELEAKADVYDGGVDAAHEIAGELRRRAAAGVRFWPAPKLLDDQPPN